MKPMDIIVPRMLVKYHLPHPEYYGESVVELLNGMITDVYTSEDHMLMTHTNDRKLIKYLSECEHQEPDYTLSNKTLNLITVKPKDTGRILEWRNQERDLEHYYTYDYDDISLYLSHAITSNSHLFMVYKNHTPVGLIGYNIMNQTAIIELNLYEKDILLKEDEDSVLTLLLNHLKTTQGIEMFKTLISKDDVFKIDVFERHQFKEDKKTPINPSDLSVNGYYLKTFKSLLSEAEKEILQEFLELYPNKLFDLSSSDDLIDLEHSMNYSLKIYARLILSNQLHYQDEFDDIFLDEGYLSLDDDLIEKYDQMMALLYGDDLIIAREYKDLMLLVLTIINKHISDYLESESYFSLKCL